MKAVGYQQSLDITESESLIDIEIDKPEVTGRDILVNVRAIAVNPVDTKIRKSVQPETGYKVLGWDAAGVVEAVGDDVTLFKPGDEVWYAGAIDRPGCNTEYHLVDERIVSKKPATLDFAHAAALPLTTITAWEMLFDRLQIARGSEKTDDVILVVGAAGGVGSIFTQLASQLTGATVIGTASRPESVEWVKANGADHVIDHGKPLSEEIKQLGIEQVTHVAAITRSDLHFAQMVEALKPFGKIAMIDDPGPIDISIMKTKSLSLHLELMYTRSLFHTDDMIEQHKLLAETARLIDDGILKTTFAQHFGTINADNLKRAHALLESGQSRGKIVLEGF